MKQINPQLIKYDPSIQARVGLNEDIVADYMEDMKRGDEFPPLIVFWDGEHESYVLADGFHRFAAWQRIDSNAYVTAQIKRGTETDARWYAICANKDNGLRRSNADKRRAVELALLHPRGSKLSNRLIARFLGVSEFLIRDIRKELESTAILSQSTVRTGVDGREIDITNIGANPMTVEGKTCGECRLFYHGRCVYHNEQQTENDIACMEFQKLLEAKPSSDTEDLPFEFEILDDMGCSEPRKKNYANYRSREGTPFFLPKSSQMAAVEIRLLRGEEWLADLFVNIGELLEKEECS